jgi:DNA helicase-2/ATP-dependent DNA helicase PcrA
LRRGGGGGWRLGSATPGAPPAGQPFRPTRDLGAKREAYAEGAPSGSLARPGADRAESPAASPTRPPRPIIPGERQYRDGDRVRHGRWGDGIVVTGKLTRSDEEITVAFKDPAVGRKTMLASLANLDLVG